jgi:hypothetical protein
LNQANFSLNQANCSLNHTNCSLNHANCSPVWPRLTIGNLDQEDARMWVHFVGVLFAAVTFCRLAQQLTQNLSEMRNAHITNSAGPDAYSALVEHLDGAVLKEAGETTRQPKRNQQKCRHLRGGLCSAGKPWPRGGDFPPAAQRCD